MKKYIIHTKTNSILTRFPALGKRLTAHQASLAESGGRLIASLGADLEKAGAAVAVQAGLTEPIQLGILSREEIVQRALRELGWHCALGLEACGFGWAFPRELRAAGAEVFTFATEALTGRRKTNQRDAAALARLVAERVVHGNLQSGRVVREPARAEQEQRFLSRHRAQLVALRGKIEGQGRGLLYDFGQLAFPECWWGKKMWPRLAAQLAARGETWLREALEAQRTLALAIHAQILELDRRLAALAEQLLTIALPHGLGALTAEAAAYGTNGGRRMGEPLTACLEVMDWTRFSNRKKVGSFIGCCPSEHSTEVAEGTREA